MPRAGPRKVQRYSLDFITLLRVAADVAAPFAPQVPST